MVNIVKEEEKFTINWVIQTLQFRHYTIVEVRENRGLLGAVS